MIPTTTTPPVLPVSVVDLLKSAAGTPTLDLETKHGNGDLLRVLDILGIAGPFRVLNPWELEDAQGRHLIHAGGYAATPFGEAYPPLLAFVREYLTANHQLGLPQQSLSEWRAALGANLVALLASVAPSHADSHVYFGNSGAEAVEAALKMARAARPKATQFINFERAYHGKTHGALALTPNEEYQAPFRPLSPDVRTLKYGDLEELERALRENADRICAIVIEPVQGEGGVIIPPPGYLQEVDRLARRHGVLVIADEIQTGLGRTGHWFASVAAGMDPDIVTLAKPLGGGLMPVAATIARKPIYHALLPGLASKRHSTTFGGGSLAMAVGLKSLELLVSENLAERSAQSGRYGLERLQAMAQRFPGLVDSVRGAGMLFAVSLKPVVGFKVPGVSEEDVQTLAAALFLRELHLGGVHGCYSTNASRTARLTPPLNFPQPTLVELFDRVEAVMAKNATPLAMLKKLPLPRMLRLARLALT
ncbi:MAG: aminotransferase class III-fold pyridoxal phosphate-dependent enzyme [Truepera sp.]|jgi:acetylornithine/succinyldiaminopimelate/putrescine aminotransferase|nr:aminotransferase class III-fold pyridoxal phosphate-dependent enzyme [Truepera sp.]